MSIFQLTYYMKTEIYNVFDKAKRDLQGLKLLIYSLFLVIACGAVLFFVSSEFFFSGKIYPGTKIANIDLGYFDSKSAQKLLENRINVWKNQKIKINYSAAGDSALPLQSLETEPEPLGFIPGTGKSILNAYNLGRTGGFLKMLLQRMSLFARGKNVAVYYDFDENKFDAYLKKNFSFLERPEKNASLFFEKGKLVQTPAENGLKIDRYELKEKLVKDIENLKNEPATLKIIVSPPQINDLQVKSAETQAQNITKRDFYLKYKNKSWVIEKNLIISALEFEPVKDFSGKEKILSVKINSEPFVDYLEKIQFEMNSQPQNAVFAVENNKLITESGGENGATLLIEASVRKIKQEILQKTKPSLVSSAENQSEAFNNNWNENKKNTDIELVVEETEPVINQKTITAKGIDTLLGRGESNFSGSPKNRRYNIAVGAAKFNNTLIAPDEEFSFNKILGEVDEKTGYLPDLVIKNDRTTPEYGGGLCQVSTTAFRAAIYSGLPITERRPHSYPVVYYNPQGMDATIYPPHPDLRFKNDTGGFILIQTKILKDKLIFNFFGKKTGRRIKIIGPNIYDKMPDGSMKAVFWREIYEGEKLVKKEVFRSVYASPDKYPHKNPFE